ncbi:MAG: hypothetical protein ACO3SM_08760 [Sedimenticolaceae bacterium]
MTKENKKEPIFTINREDGTINEVFESDLDEKTIPLANELTSVNRTIQSLRESDLFKQALNLTQSLRSLERDASNLATQLDSALSNDSKVEVVE